MVQYIAGVLNAVARDIMLSDAAYPEVTGLVRHMLVGMADAQYRRQPHAEREYLSEAFIAEPRIIHILDIGMHSERAADIYRRAYGVAYPLES